MKPVQIVLLVVAGALGGAIVTRNWNKPHPKPAITAQAQPQPATPAPAPPEPAAQAPAPVATSPAAVEPTPEPAKPSPAPRPATPKVRRPAKAAPPPANPRPLETVPVEAKAIPPAAQPAATPSEPAPAPTPRSEPEHVTSAPAPPPPPEPNRVTLNAGMLIPVRLVDGLTSERNMPGDVFTGTLDRELVVDGFVIAERGARVDGRVVSSDQGGKVKGVASLAIELTRIRTSDGQTVAVQTDAFERHAEASHRSDATKVGAGAALGAIIGAIAGGGKGAAIGAGAGGAAGAGTVLMTRGKAAALTSETRINFRLRAPVTITEKK